MTIQQLTKEQIRAIVNRLDNVVGNHFHDAICAEVDEEVEDIDVYEIKKRLALDYLEEWQEFTKKENA